MARSKITIKKHIRTFAAFPVLCQMAGTHIQAEPEQIKGNWTFGLAGRI